MIREFKGIRPKVHPDAILLDPCTVIGDVEIAAEASVWFGAVIRGDVGPVRIGARSNVQDGALLHETSDYSHCIVGEDVTIGHGAIVHGAILKDRCLIGMGAIILDNAVVGHDCLVGAGALVPEGMVIPDGHLAIGVPAKVKRPLTPEEIRSLKESAEHYVQYAKQTVAG
jgi:carbonic anhydrase/acetyltransferase-like protein (isoleucine patch superfamily)